MLFRWTTSTRRRPGCALLDIIRHCLTQQAILHRLPHSSVLRTTRFRPAGNRRLRRMADCITRTTIRRRRIGRLHTSLLRNTTAGSHDQRRRVRCNPPLLMRSQSLGTIRSNLWWFNLGRQTSLSPGRLPKRLGRSWRLDVARPC